MEFSQETRRNSQKVTAHIAAFRLTEVTAGNRSNQPQRGGRQHRLPKTVAGKADSRGSTLMPVATAPARQEAERQLLGGGRLEIASFFCPMFCLQPHELHYLPSGMVSFKAVDPMTFREARGFTLSFSLRENERLVLEDPQKRLTTM